MKQNAEYQRHSFFSRPGWRWDRVLEMCDRSPQPGRATRRDDAFVRQARSFLLRWRGFVDQPNRREELFWEIPGLYYAHEIHERSLDEPEAALTIQARILARQTNEEIADLMGLLPEAVYWYEAMFFSVRDRLDQRDWVTKQVLVPATLRNVAVHDRGITLSRADGPETPFALPFYDVSLKLFAYFGGPVLLDFMLTGFQHGQQVSDPKSVDAFLDSYLSSAVKRRAVMAATTLDVNQYNALQLIELSARLMEIERNAELGAAAKSSIDNHVLGMINELPWMAGEEGCKLAGRQGKKIGTYDEGNVELRDDELLVVAAGELPTGLQGLDKFELPSDITLRRRATNENQLPPPASKQD